MDFHSSEHPLSWFKKQYLEGTLILRPPYQRKPVWAARQKCYLIESILLKLPIPEIYIEQSTTAEGETTYAIVDGQQRVRTVLQFVAAETDPGEEEFNGFPLDMLAATSPWKDQTFADLSEGERKRFYGYMFAVRYLDNASEGDVRDMFRRLNKYLSPLKPQELRNATYTGPFAQLALELADSPYWAENGIVTPAYIRRMSDVEFVSELLIGLMHGPQGGSARVIDSYYETYEDYEDEFPEQDTTEALFNETLSSMEQVLPKIKRTRWSNKADFYSLFMVLGAQLRTKSLPRKNVPSVRRALEQFAADIDRRRVDDEAKVPRHVVAYLRALERGANDKPRRAARHGALLMVTSKYFVGGIG